MFLKSARDQYGYWDSVNATTSTVDWCESNYTVSYYVAEWQNCFSSLWIAFGGLVGLYWALKYGHNRSLQAVAFLIFCVGIGSALFHGTLLYLPQMLDELPMMWATCAFFYLFLEIAQLNCHKKRAWYNSLPDSPLKRSIAIDLDDPYSYLLQYYPSVPFYYLSKAIHGTRIQSILSTSIALTMAILMLLISFFHYTYGFVTVFQTFFGILTAASLVCLLSLPIPYSHLLSTDQSRLQAHHVATLRSYRNWSIYYVSTAVAASICWMIDNNFCTALLMSPVYISGHALWHWLNYFATYSGLLLAGYGLQMAKGSEVDMFEIEQRLKLSETAGEKLTIAEADIPLLHAGVAEVYLLPDPLITPFSPLIALANQLDDKSPV